MSWIELNRLRRKKGVWRRLWLHLQPYVLNWKKKKLKKKEEQERLDEEGAAIAEAVALQVLRGEDSDDSKKKDEGFTSWDHAHNVNFVMGSTQPHSYDVLKYSCENVGRISDDTQYGRMWNFWGNSNLIASANHLGSGFYPRYFGGEVWDSVRLSAEHRAAQAISSLRIADEARVDAFVFDRFVRG